MPNLTTVGLTAGAATSGTGPVSTLDNVIGVAGTPSAQVQTVQGITSMTPLKVDGSATTQPISGTLAATQSGTWTVQPGNTANTTAWKVDNTAALDKGSGTGGTVTQRVIIDSSQAGSLGAAASASSVPVVPATDWVGTTALSKFGTGYYVTVAASQTATVLQSSAGATGDYVSGVLVIPATTSPGNVLLLDNATSITIFTGGATSVTNLVPFFIPLGAVSRSGAWKLTTGANVSCIAIGKFS